MTIWCQLGRRLLNTRKSWIYMMKKRPVFQEDQAPRNGDSATRKQLVLVRAKYESSLSDFLLLAVPGPDSFAWLPRHVYFSPPCGSQRVPLPRSQLLWRQPLHCHMYNMGSFSLQTSLFVFLLKRTLVFIYHILSIMNECHLNRCSFFHSL